MEKLSHFDDGFLIYCLCSWQLTLVGLKLFLLLFSAALIEYWYCLSFYYSDDVPKFKKFKPSFTSSQENIAVVVDTTSDR